MRANVIVDRACTNANDYSIVRVRAACLLIASCAIGVSHAQEVGDSRAPVWRMGVSATIMATDNVGAVSSDPKSGTSAESSFELHLSLPYRRLRGFVDYSLTGAAVRADETTFDHRNALLAGLNAEVVESHLFLEMAATYGTQLRSVFASPTRSLSVENGNRVESGTASVSPILRGLFGETGRYEARATDTTTKYRDTDNGDVHAQMASLLIDSGTRPRSLSWKGQAFGAVNDFKVGRRTTEALVRADVGWAFDAETVASLIAGREGNDFESARRIYSDLYGLSIEYRPNERTRLYAERLNRFFGVGHLVSFSYRLPRFAVLASSARSSTTPGTELTGATAFVQGSAYDVMFLQFASVEPDPDRRRILVQDLLSANGIDPSQQVVPKLAASGVLLVERHDLSVAWSGVRDTAIVALTRSSSSQFGSLINLPVNTDFQVADRVDQTGVRIDWFRRLTQVDGLSASLAWVRSEGGLTQRSSTYRAAQAQWSRQLSVRSGVELGLKHEDFDSSVESAYSVNMLSCTYRVRF